MAGLLYKDFIAIHGKLLTGALVLVTLIIMMFSVTVTSDDLIVVVGMFSMALSLLLPLTVIGAFEQSIFSADAGGKKKAWLMSLPVKKSQYVASKYIFLLICEYVLLSVGIVWLYFLNLPMEKALPNYTLLGDVTGLLPIWVMFCLAISAIELPFFVGFGMKAGSRIKICILFILCFGLIAYILFGDLDVLDRFNLMALITYLKEHTELFMALNVFTPVIVGALYYLSYRISVALFVRKEICDEE